MRAPRIVSLYAAVMLGRFLFLKFEYVCVRVGGVDEEFPR